jgi:hypothetical protein
VGHLRSGKRLAVSLLPTERFSLSLSFSPRSELRGRVVVARAAGLKMG